MTREVIFGKSVYLETEDIPEETARLFLESVETLLDLSRIDFADGPKLTDSMPAVGIKAIVDPNISNPNIARVGFSSEMENVFISTSTNPLLEDTLRRVDVDILTRVLGAVATIAVLNCRLTPTSIEDELRLFTRFVGDYDRTVRTILGK